MPAFTHASAQPTCCRSCPSAPPLSMRVAMWRTRSATASGPTCRSPFSFTDTARSGRSRTSARAPPSPPSADPPSTLPPGPRASAAGAGGGGAGEGGRRARRAGGDELAALGQRLATEAESLSALHSSQEELLAGAERCAALAPVLQAAVLLDAELQSMAQLAARGLRDALSEATRLRYAARMAALDQRLG